MQRRAHDVAIAAGLGLAVILSRLPFRGAILYHWDSINFARALEHFDVAAGQPHVPGYILYVGLARAINTMVGDPQATLVAISVVGSGLAVGALYGLGTVMFERRVGLLAALLLATSPLFWFYGEIALPHCLDAFIVVAVVWLLCAVAQGARAALIPAAIGLAVAGGFRPQTQTFLLPLALYATWRFGWRRLPLAPLLAVYLSVNLAWLVPLMWLTGGYARYLQISREFYAAFASTTSIVSGGFPGLRRNALKLGMYTLYAWGLGVLPVAAAVVTTGRSRRAIGAALRDPRCHFLCFWVLPSAAVYLLVHMGQQGLVFVFLPALCLVSAHALRGGGAAPSLLAAILVIGNSLVFLAAPTFPLGGDRPKLLTRETLRQHDADYRARIDAVRRQFPPEHTLLVSSQWRFPEYYLPEYRLVRYGVGARWEVGAGLPTVRDEQQIAPDAIGLGPDRNGAVSVVVFDEELVPFNQSRDRVRWWSLSGGRRLPYLQLIPPERLYIGPHSYGIVSAAPMPE